MSMMETIRQGTESTAVRTILGVVLVVFVFWGIGSSNTGNSGQTIATVDGVQITDTEYNRRMRSAMHQQQAGMGEEEQKALANKVINELIMDEVMLREAKRVGLEVSGEEVAQTIFEIEAFKDEAGKFSSDLYNTFLKRYGYKRATFEEDLRRQLLTQKLHDLAARGVDVTDAEVKAWWIKEETRLELDFVRVVPLNFLDDVQPTQAEIDTFVNENGPEITTWYREHFEGRFHKPLRAQVRTLVLKRGLAEVDDATLEARMKDIEAEARAGADFETLCRKYSEDLSAVNGGEVGILSRDLMDPDTQKAVFGADPAAPLTEAGLRPAVPTEKGLQLILVEQILPEETTTEEQAKPEIARTLLQERKAPELAKTFAEDLRVTWKAAGSAPMDRLLAQNLAVEGTGPVSLADPVVRELKDLPDVARALPAARTGDVLDQVFTTGDAWYVVQVRVRTEPDEAAFEAGKEKARFQLKIIRQGEFIQAWRDDLVSRSNVVRNVRL